MDSEIENLSTRIEQDADESIGLRDDVKELQNELAAPSKKNGETDKVRTDQHSDFAVAQKDLSVGLAGIQMALEQLRALYGRAAFVQSSDMACMDQPAMPKKHTKSGGAGESIIDILEGCKSDVSRFLTKESSPNRFTRRSMDMQTQVMQPRKLTVTRNGQGVGQRHRGIDNQD